MHICLQSGSDHVLQQMHRKYTVEDFVNLCKYARRKIKNLAITTDVIVGFPTETNEDFNATINNLKKVKFANIHLFPYSSRPFTTASKLKNIVSDTLKKQRFMKIMDLNNQLQKDFLKKFVGQTVQVIFENSKEKDIQVGHSEYAFTVKVKTMRNLHKQLRSVSVTKLVDKQLFGQLV
ncbi:hypothetical protein FACS1894218_5490 [Bacilli bacterium]|nr:hypothetical protein FACS1894218_5490 [Bacilli bacterium]